MIRTQAAGRIRSSSIGKHVMVPVLAFLLGFAFGWQRARVRGGDRLDKLQYATVHGIIFTVVAFAGLVVVESMTAA